MKKSIFSITALFLGLVVLFASCDPNETSENSELEPNNSFSEANVLDLDVEYDAKIDPDLDIDYFKVSATGDVNVSVKGDNTLEVRVHFFDQDQIDFYGDDAGDYGATLSKTVSSDEYEGYFYFKVENAYGNGIGDYTITCSSN